MKKNRNLIINICRIALAAAGVAGMLICGSHLERIEADFKTAENTTAILAEKYISAVEKEKTAEKAEETSSVVKDEKDGFPEIDFEGLDSECTFGSVAGWLYCEGTNINYPIAQCDDNYYYLHRLLDGTENYSGTLYTDYRCMENFRGTNTIVYGHNMANGTMFGELAKYINDRDFYNEHPGMLLSTPDGDYSVEIFSAFVTVTSNEMLWKTEFSNDEEYEEYLEYIRSENRIPEAAEAEVTVNDKIVSFITCAYDTDHSRTVVYGKLNEIS